jgi:hypothetical protein
MNNYIETNWDDLKKIRFEFLDTISLEKFIKIMSQCQYRVTDTQKKIEKLYLKKYKEFIRDKIVAGFMLPMFDGISYKEFADYIEKRFGIESDIYPELYFDVFSFDLPKDTEKKVLKVIHKEYEKTEQESVVPDGDL